MKVIWFVPPTHKGKFPNIGQYRFYKNMPVRVSIEYPYLNAMGVTQLDEAGFDVEFIDCPTEDLKWLDVDEKLKQVELVLMEARTPIINYIYEVSDCLRSDKVKVALFGDHVTWLPEEALAHCDYVVSGGDYDFGATELALALQSQKYPVPRVFNAGLVENLDLLPHVNRELVLWSNYYEAWRNREVYIYTMSGRGCWYNCNYCAWIKLLWQNRVRQRSVKDVADEFEEAYNKYGECEIWDDHDCFDTQWGLKFAEELLNRGFTHKEILWAVQTHSNMINDRETLRIMKKAGLHVVKLGIESGNQTTLNRIRKGATIEQHERAIKLLKEADIMVHANMMVGFPYETKKQAYQTIDWLKKLDPNQAQFSLTIPYPWTDLFREAKENGWLLVQEGDWESYDATTPMIRMEGMTPEETAKLYRDCWSKFYLNRKYMWRHLKTVKNWQDIKQLYRGFKSVYFGHMKAINPDRKV